MNCTNAVSEYDNNDENTHIHSYRYYQKRRDEYYTSLFHYVSVTFLYINDGNE